jgi:membrane associated rhomboid family serine protease
MAKRTVCPNLSWKLFTAWITAIDSVVFLAMTLLSLIMYSSLSQNGFLGPDPELLKYVDKDPYKIVNNYQIYRLVTPIFIHLSFSHIIFNMIA